MLSVNSNPTIQTAPAFKGCPKKTVMDPAFKKVVDPTMERIQQIMSSDLDKVAKQRAVDIELISRLSQMSWLDKLKCLFSKKPF